ncbi:hypothetical protein HYT55_02345 [Candidatus Woesearchaeota archaeon]|nr:hypothetical protein [Candidatus Woesearchaeota archaeon]
MKYLLGVLGLALIIISTTLFLGVKAVPIDSTGSETDRSLIKVVTENQATTAAVGKEQAVTQPTLSGITTMDLQKHNTMSDCWVGYQQKVYDITTWLPKHPGSAKAILPYCGTAAEFEQAFTKKHGKSKVSLFMRVAVFMGDFSPQGDLQ